MAKNQIQKQFESVLVSAGYFKLSEKNRKLITTVLLISLGVHILAGLIFGSVIVVRSLIQEKTVFETPPPPMKSYEPKQLEHKVKVQKRQKSSSRPSVVPRLVAMKTSDIALPEIKMNPKLIHTAFQPKFKAVQGTGLGAGIGTGHGVGGFGPGVSKFDFFGIKGKGEKIMLCIDVSISMVEDQRGGIKGFARVKNRFDSVIEALAEGTMFNVVAFADAAQTFEDKLQVANDENKKRAKAFLKPFNSNLANLGLSSGNVRDDGKGLPAQGGTTRLDLALTASFQQGADTILIISDGAPMVLKGMTAEAMQAYNTMVAQWNEQHRGEIDAYNDAMANAQVEKVKVWHPPQPARPPRPPGGRPLKEGEPPDMGDPGAPATPGYWEEKEVRHGPTKRPTPPPPPKPQYWTLNEFLTHLKMLHEAYYLKKGVKTPTIHCIGYQMDKDGIEFLQALCKTYKGQFRQVKKID